MNIVQIIGISVGFCFYTAFLVKMLLQRSRGIITNHMGKGQKPPKTFVVERLLKFATVAVVPSEIISIVIDIKIFNNKILEYIGFFMSAAGLIVFIISIITMKDSWRAGISETEKTTLIQSGIYKISRNPAFLGFDLVYIGLALAFFNPINIVFSLFAVIMLHLQILEEEKFLPSVFGEEYIKYKEKTARYFLIF